MWTKTNVVSLDPIGGAPKAPFVVRCSECPGLQLGPVVDHDDAEREQRRHIRDVHPLKERSCDACGAPLVERREGLSSRTFRTECSWQCHLDAKRAERAPEGALF